MNTPRNQLTLGILLGVAASLGFWWSYDEDARRPTTSPSWGYDFPRPEAIADLERASAEAPTFEPVVEEAPRGGEDSRAEAGDVPSPHVDSLALFPLALFEGLEDDWAPTPEGLFAQTTGQWNQPGFLDLSTDEARELLPIVEGELGTFPQTIHALVGGFPTLEDCQRAYESPEVREAHLRFLRLEVLVTELGRTPIELQAGTWRQFFDAQLAARETAALDLYAACERASGYHDWRLAFRLYERWIE